MKTSLGLHIDTGSRNGYGMTAPHAKGIITWTGGPIDSVSAGTYRIYRPHQLYEWPPGSGGGLSDIMPGFNELSVSDMKSQAEYWWPLMRDRADETAAAHGRIDAIKPTNEVGGNDVESLKKLVEYEKWLGIQAHAEGRVITVGNCATDSPHWSQYIWQTIIAPHVREMWDLGHIYSRNTYADNIDGVDYLIRDGKPAGPSSERPFKEIEFFKREYGVCGPIVLGELGFVTFPGVTHFMQEIQKYDAYLKNYSEIGFAALFTYGEWNSGAANIEDASMQLAQHLRENPFEVWKPSFEVQPPMDKPKIVIAKKPQKAAMTSAENERVSRWAWENFGRTTTHSHDDMLTMLSIGNPESYAVVWWPERQDGVIELLQSHGYNYTTMPGDTEPPTQPPPTGETYSTHFMVPDPRSWVVVDRGPAGGEDIWHLFTDTEMIRVKNRNQAEWYSLDGLKRFRDTSPADDDSDRNNPPIPCLYLQYTDGDLGGHIAPAVCEIGKTYTYWSDVQFKAKSDCRNLSYRSGRARSTFTLVEVRENYTFPNGVTVDKLFVTNQTGEIQLYAVKDGVKRGWCGGGAEQPGNSWTAIPAEFHLDRQIPQEIPPTYCT